MPARGPAVTDDIAREDDAVELADPPRFAMGERVASRTVVRNDGTFAGKAIGAVLVGRGDVGYVRSIGTYLQQFYIYAVEFMDAGCRVGMRAKELCTLDRLPPDVIERLRARLGDDAARLDALR
ncbi:MAG TPA: nitrogen fixation protein NifZ [Albitalea sp.]